jgi:TonB family protein
LLVPIIFGAVGGRVAAQADSDVVPLVRIAPTYPPEAISAGRDGDVRLRFTIAADGATKDIVVEESTSPEFEQPATAALKRWIYAPRVVDGEPVERRDVLTIIRFRIDCASRARDPQQPATGVAPNCSK